MSPRPCSLPAALRALIAFCVSSCTLGLLPGVRASTGAAISDVRITNVRDTSFTVSWVTDGGTSGRVEYGTDPSNLSHTAHDDRGESLTDDTHYVTIVGLNDETTYHFEVISGGTTEGGHTVTTGPTLTLPGWDLAYGQVFKSGGSILARGTIVYLTLSDGDSDGSAGSAAPMSALVDGYGYWNASLGNARVADLSAYFDYSASGDDLLLDAQGAADGTITRTVDTGEDAPAPSMTLLGGVPPTPRVYLPLLMSRPGGTALGADSSPLGVFPVFFSASSRSGGCR